MTRPYRCIYCNAVIDASDKGICPDCRKLELFEDFPDLLDESDFFDYDTWTDDDWENYDK